MIKLALTDLDNTLIPMGAPHASVRAIAAIHAMLNAGLHFGPVSGRVPAAMRWMFGGDEACSKTVPSSTGSWCTWMDSPYTKRCCQGQILPMLGNIFAGMRAVRS